jgi:ATP-dependent DNA helicase RecQ
MLTPHQDPSALTKKDPRAVLKQNFGLDGFRPGQQEIISSILSGRDVMAVLPTGGGKSLCFQFPAVYAQKLVVVVSPLIALMQDQVRGLKSVGIPAGALHSGQSLDEKRQIFSDLKKGEGYVLYLSPERVQKEGFQGWIRGQNVGLFAIDEAHCVSQWGHDFRSEYAQLKILKKLRPDVPTLALTASATPLVLDDISKQLGLNKPERRVHGFYRSNLYFQVEKCEEDEKLPYLMAALKQFPEGRAIVYCGTRKTTEMVASRLEKEFLGVGHYHAGLSADQRTKIQKSYSQSELRILVATNAFGMGIDQPDVRLVVHYNMPANLDALSQEMGRAGRDGQESTCMMLYSGKDKGLQSFFIQSSEAHQDIKNLRWRNLDTLVYYAEGGECRHAEILTYYRDAQRLKTCGHCDNCAPDSSRRVKPDRSAFAQFTKLAASGVEKPKSSAKTKSKKALAPEEDALTSAQDKELFAKLKEWRLQKARELDVPAFVIFGDKTLRQLCLRRPENSTELLKIYGIGPEKAERFGAELIAEIGF